MADKNPLTYADAGVSFEAETEAIARLKKLVQTTYRPEVLSDVGTFGGLFALQKVSRTCACFQHRQCRDKIKGCV